MTEAGAQQPPTPRRRPPRATPCGPREQREAERHSIQLPAGVSASASHASPHHTPAACACDLASSLFFFLRKWAADAAAGHCSCTTPHWNAVRRLEPLGSSPERHAFRANPSAWSQKNALPPILSATTVYPKLDMASMPPWRPRGGLHRPALLFLLPLFAPIDLHPNAPLRVRLRSQSARYLSTTRIGLAQHS